MESDRTSGPVRHQRCGILARVTPGLLVPRDKAEKSTGTPSRLPEVELERRDFTELSPGKSLGSAGRADAAAHRSSTCRGEEPEGVTEVSSRPGESVEGTR